MADDLQMSPDAAAPIIEHFRDLAAEFDNARFESYWHATGIDTACGEFAPSVADGTDAYQISWKETMAFCGETSALIAGNTNVFLTDLTRLDTDLAHLPTI